jgi:hypothetical protein
MQADIGDEVSFIKEFSHKGEASLEQVIVEVPVGPVGSQSGVPKVSTRSTERGGFQLNLAVAATSFSQSADIS